MSLMKIGDRWQEWRNLDVRTTAKFWKIEWSGDELDEGQKARRRKKERKYAKQEAKLCQRAQASGHYPLTLPLEVYDGYQPINKCHKWTKEACVNPLVKRTLSWCLVSILTRVISGKGRLPFHGTNDIWLHSVWTEESCGEAPGDQESGHQCYLHVLCSEYWRRMRDQGQQHRWAHRWVRPVEGGPCKPCVGQQILLPW